MRLCLHVASDTRQVECVCLGESLGRAWESGESYQQANSGVALTKRFCIDRTLQILAQLYSLIHHHNSVMHFYYNPLQIFLAFSIQKTTRLLVILLLGVAGTTLLGVLSLNSTGSASAVGRVEGKVNVLLGLESNHERGNVDNLLADSDVSLGDEHSGVVDGLGEAELEDLGLQSSLEEILGGQSKHVIELHLVLGKNTESNQPSDKGVTLEKTLGVLLVSGKQLSGSSSDLGQLETNSVNLPLVLETKLTVELELGVKSGRLVGSVGGRRGLGVGSRGSCMLVGASHDCR